MIDLGISKLALIGMVALVVIGPERLPKVARTAGALLGRAQRYIADVKAEVSREIELEELRKMRTEFEQAARNVEQTIHQEVSKHTTELNERLNEALGDPAQTATSAPDSELGWSNCFSFRSGRPTPSHQLWKNFGSSAPSETHLPSLVS